MFHVFQAVPLGFSRNSSKFQKINIFKSQSQYGGRAWNFYKSKSLYRWGKTSTTISLQVEGSLAGVWGLQPPQTLALPKRTAISLQGELGAYMEETVGRVTPRQQAVFEGVKSLEFF